MLYGKARERIALLEAENKQLKERIRELEKKDSNQNVKVEALAFQLEQIQNRVFGKKPPVLRMAFTRERKERDSSSYRRPIPQRITETRHPVNACAHCARTLTKRSIKTFYEEDLPLPIETRIVKHEVEIGYCPACTRVSSGCVIPSAKSVLGETVKKYICLLSISNRLSHDQIRNHLSEVFRLVVSRGEIGNILTAEAESAASHTRNPSPLSKIKEALRKNKECYLAFLAHPGVPVDNNKAERALRHLVLKRKVSFGSKTQRGAETTSILVSVIMSLKWNDPNGWFQKYLALKP